LSQEAESGDASFDFTLDLSSGSSSGSDGESGDRVRRRELAFQAAQRRMHHSD